MTETLCRLFGTPVSNTDEQQLYAFPTPQTLAEYTEADLAPVRAGYRARYVLSAARRVAGGFDLDALRSLTTEQARKQLMELDGVGRKVADFAVRTAKAGRFSGRHLDEKGVGTLDIRLPHPSFWRNCRNCSAIHLLLCEKSKKQRTDAEMIAFYPGLMI